MFKKKLIWKHTPAGIRQSPTVSSTKFIWKTFNTLFRYYMLAGSLVCEQDWHKLLKGSGGAANATGAPGAVRKGKVGRPRRSRDWAPPARAPKPPPPQPATPPDFEQVFIASLLNMCSFVAFCRDRFVVRFFKKKIIKINFLDQQYNFSLPKIYF